jgi:hypothetical protein
MLVGMIGICNKAQKELMAMPHGPVNLKLKLSSLPRKILKFNI